MVLRVLLIFLAGLIGTLFVVTAWRAEARRQTLEARYPPLGQILDVGGVPVHAVQLGDGPDLVLIHGAGGTVRDMMQGLAQDLAQDYRVTVFDRPGHGYTGRTSKAYQRAFTNLAESPREQAELLRAAAQQLGLSQPILAGHSYGGTVTLAWASTYPQEVGAVVNMGGVALPWPGKLKLYYRANGSRLGSLLLPPLIAAWASDETVFASADGVFAPNAPIDAYGDSVGALLSIRTNSFRANARQVNGLRPHVVRQTRDYFDITAPIELVHGDLDATVPLDIHAGPLAEMLPNAQLTVLEGVAHMPHHVAKDDVIAAVHRAAERAGLR